MEREMIMSPHFSNSVVKWIGKLLYTLGLKDLEKAMERKTSLHLRAQGFGEVSSPHIRIPRRILKRLASSQFISSY